MKLIDVLYRGLAFRGGATKQFEADLKEEEVLIAQVDSLIKHNEELQGIIKEHHINKGDHHQKYMICKIIALFENGLDAESIARRMSLEEGSTYHPHYVSNWICYYNNNKAILKKELL